MLNGKAILVVDDEPDLREILCEEFQLLGARVEAAPNGREALKKTEEQRFDVVVSDLRMPGGDGVSLTRALKERAAPSPLVMLMTGFADLTAEEAFEIGAESFLTKPFHLETIRDSLHRLLTPVAERWAKSGTVTKFDVQSANDLFAGRDPATYLGRGGFFLPGQGWRIRVGQEISFDVGSLQGMGIVRWVRSSSSAQRGPGAGVEFLGLAPQSLKMVVDFLEKERPQAYLPRGF